MYHLRLKIPFLFFCVFSVFCGQKIRLPYFAVKTLSNLDGRMERRERIAFFYAAQ
jgi:hypothetical protein